MEMSRKDVGRDREVCVEFGWQEKRTKIGWEVRLGDTFRFFFLEAKFCNNALLLWEEKKEDFQTNSIGELLDCSST